MKGGNGDEEPTKPVIKIPDYKNTDPTVSRLEKEAEKEYINEFQDKNKFQNRQPQIDLKVYQPENKPKYPTEIPYAPYLPSFAEPALPTIIKPTNYNIQIGGPSADYTKVKQIYEDILPQEILFKSKFTLSGRNNLKDAIFKGVFNNKNGQNININSNTNENITSYIKFKELTINQPEIIIYKSCYPIRQDPTNMVIKCASNSSALNVRIYSNIKDNVITFYNKINNFLDNFISPNFIKMYGYAFCTNHGITFSNNSQPNDITLLLSESPSYSIESLFIKSGVNIGNLYKMAHKTTYTKEEKENILFQLIVIFEICKTHKIDININNIFVMDTSLDKYDKYWCYKINNNKFLLKNIGFLCVVDLNIIDADVPNINVPNIIDPNVPNNNSNLNFINIFSNVLSDLSFNNNTSNNIIELITTNCPSILNNKIGKILSNSEKTNILQNAIYNFTEGEIIVYPESYNNYYFGMIIKNKSSTNNKYTILSKDFRTIDVNAVFKYNNDIPYVNNNQKNISENDIIETYNIN